MWRYRSSPPGVLTTRTLLLLVLYGCRRLYFKKSVPCSTRSFPPGRMSQDRTYVGESVGAHCVGVVGSLLSLGAGCWRSPSMRSNLNTIAKFGGSLLPSEKCGKVPVDQSKSRLCGPSRRHESRLPVSRSLNFEAKRKKRHRHSLVHHHDGAGHSALQTATSRLRGDCRGRNDRVAVHLRLARRPAVAKHISPAHRSPRDHVWTTTPTARMGSTIAARSSSRTVSTSSTPRLQSRPSGRQAAGKEAEMASTAETAVRREAQRRVCGNTEG